LSVFLRSELVRKKKHRALTDSEALEAVALPFRLSRPRPRRSPSRPGVSIPQSGAAELPSIRGAANIGRRATDDDPLTFLKLLKIDVFVVSQPPVNDPVVHLPLAYKHAPFLKGHDQIEVVYFDGATMNSELIGSCECQAYLPRTSVGNPMRQSASLSAF